MIKNFESFFDSRFTFAGNIYIVFKQALQKSLGFFLITWPDKIKIVAITKL